MTQSMRNVQIVNVNSKLVFDIRDDGKTVTQRKPDPDKKASGGTSLLRTNAATFI